MTQAREELRARADENLVAAFDLVREHLDRPPEARRRFGSVQAIATGHELAFYNPVLALDSALTQADVLAAADWITEQRMPASVHLSDAAPAAIGRELGNRGFVADDEIGTVMALVLTGATQASPAELQVRAGGVELAESWYRVYGGTARFRATFNGGFLGDERVRIAVAELGGEPVAAAAAFQSGRTLGVYAVETVEHARRRGYGRAVTWAAIGAGHTAWQSDLAILQSSEMGVPLYRSMGFETVAAIRIYRRQPA